MLRSALSWLRSLPQNPVYLREKGRWGQTNAFYKKAMGLSPFFLLGALVLALCTSFSTPDLFANAEFLILMWCVLWFPNLMLSTMSLFASFIIPTLTAPTISLERASGTWDILRTTPQSTESILFAKLFASLNRMWIWQFLAIFTIPQIFISMLVILLDPANNIIMSIIDMVYSISRAPLEILFAALLGLFFSTTMRSATGAIISSYVCMVLFRLFNNTILWTAVFNMASSSINNLAAVTLSRFSTTAVYVAAVTSLLFGTIYQARKLTY